MKKLFDKLKNLYWLKISNNKKA